MEGIRLRVLYWKRPEPCGQAPTGARVKTSPPGSGFSRRARRSFIEPGIWAGNSDGCGDRTASVARVWREKNPAGAACARAGWRGERVLKRWSPGPAGLLPTRRNCSSVPAKKWIGGIPGIVRSPITSGLARRETAIADSCRSSDVSGERQGRIGQGLLVHRGDPFHAGAGLEA